MSSTRRLCYTLLSLLLLFSVPVTAQVSAAISGRVTDQTGAAVSGATVTAKDTDMGISRVTVTDERTRRILIRRGLNRHGIEYG